MTYLRTQNIYDIYETNLDKFNTKLNNINYDIPQISYVNDVSLIPKIDIKEIKTKKLKKLSNSDIAYITYHPYYENQSLTSVSCSDGSNGLITKTGYISLTNELWPYVTSWSDIVWNSPKCGTCIKLEANNDKSVNVIVIDGCSKSNNGETHFDVSELSYLKLFGNKDSGFGYANFSVVDKSKCGI